MNKIGNKEPKKEAFGWSGFELDGNNGWMIEGGEDAYFEALEKWKNTVNIPPNSGK